MAFPTVVGVGTVAASQTGDIVPGLPGGLAADDLMFMPIETSVPGTVATPSGWAHVLGSPLAMASDNRGTMFWKRAVGGESAPTIVDSGDHQIARIIAIRGGVNTGDPWSGTPVFATSALRDPDHDIGPTTTVDDECLVLVGMMSDVPDSTTTAAFSGWSNGSLGSLTEQIDNGTALGDGGCIGLATGTLATAGSSGTTTVTVSIAPVGIVFAVGIKPASIPDVPHPAPLGMFDPEIDSRAWF